MKGKRFGVLLLLAAIMLVAAACGTVSTEQAASYSDDVAAVNIDEIPEGQPQPIDGEDENKNIDESKEGTCVLVVECSTILNHMESLPKEKQSLVPEDGVIFPKQEVPFYEGETVFDVLKREMIENKIHLEFSWTPLYDSHYVEGIANLYEFDCGSLSGWTYCVNDWFPNYGASRYLVSEGDVIGWHYTCDLGKDVGSDME